MKSPTEEPGCRKNRWQCGCWCHLSLEGPNTDDFYCYTCFIMEFTSRPWSYWDFYTYLCLFDSSFFFFNHAAVDVLAFLSFFLVEFLSVLLFSFGFGHFWHIWWACSRPILFLVLTCRGFATPYSIKYYIGYQVYLLTWFIPEDSMSYPCIYIMQ